MATARNLHPEEAAAIKTVTFEYVNGVLTVLSPVVLMSATDQIAIGNSPSSTASITLVFAANPPGVANPPGASLFSHLANPLTLAPGVGTGLMTPSVSNGAVNYIVQVNGTQVGDTYAIQVGSGPLYVTVNGTTCTPQTVVVPYQGAIEFFSTDGANHSITWNANAGNPFPGLTTIYPTLNNPPTKPYQETLPVNNFTYTVGPSPIATGGSGTVKVKSAS